MCGCEFACGHEHGGVCLGVRVWVSCNAGLLACSQSIILGGFYVVFFCFIPFLANCHYYVWHFTIMCPFYWLVAICFIRSGLLVTAIYLGLA